MIPQVTSLNAIGLLDKIIAMYAWSPQCADWVTSLAEQRETYSVNMNELEKWVKQSKEDTPLTEAERALPDDICRDLYRRIVNEQPLFDLFQENPLFSEVLPEQVAELAQFADIKPDAETTLRTRDTVFMRIWQSVLRGEKVASEEVFLADLAKLIRLDMSQPELSAMLAEIAQTKSWAFELLRVESALETPKGQSAELTKIASPDEDKLMKKIQSVASGPGPMLDSVRQIMLSAPRFSQMLPEAVLVFWQHREQLTQARSSIPTAIAASSSAFDQSRLLAATLLSQFSSVERASLAQAVQLRIDAAIHFFDLRRFAKLDAFATRWPALARLLGSDLSTLIVLEGQAIQPESLPVEFETHWEQYLRDEQLLRFLKLRPLFRDIATEKIQDYLAVAKVVAGTPAIPVPAEPKPGRVPCYTTWRRNWGLSPMRN